MKGRDYQSREHANCSHAILHLDMENETACRVCELSGKEVPIHGFCGNHLFKEFDDSLNSSIVNNCYEFNPCGYSNI